MNDTQKYYDKNASELISKYDQTDVEQLHNLIKKCINDNDYILDIGFGSGRDLRYLMSFSNHVYGLDSNQKFIDNAKKFLSADKVVKTVLPDINIDNFDTDKFDILVSIAVIMHLTFEEIEKTILNMKSILKKNGKIIISYSLEREIVDGRFFEKLTKKKVTQLFEKNGFVEKECLHNFDNMNRDIQWVTQVFHIWEDKQCQ